MVSYWINVLFGWLDAQNGAITSVATVFIAVFTIVLAVVSRRQTKIISDQLKLASDEFAVTHRPRIVVRGFTMMNPELTIGEPPRFVFNAHNIGDSPARIIEVRSGTLVLPIDKEIPSNLGFQFFEKFDVTLRSGQKEVFPGNGGDNLVDNETVEIHGKTKVLLCMGIVVYLDGAGNRRETGFCRRYHSNTRRWDAFENEYEYAY